MSSAIRNPILAALAFSVMSVGATRDGLAQSSRRDSAAVVDVVHSYHRLLAAGDSLGALRLLAPDAIILESGGVESRGEYRSHHLSGDIEFSRAVPSKTSDVRVVVAGDVAWATSTSVTEGTFKDRPINSAGAELMVLSRIRTSAGRAWRIRAIHWSSRRRTP